MSGRVPPAGGARGPRRRARPPAGAEAREAPAAVRAVRRVSDICGVLSAAMILSAVLVTCHMIFVRAVLGRSTIWQTEAVIYLVIGATLIGLPYVQRLRGHVSVDLIPSMLPPAGRRVLALFVLVATLAMAGGMTWYGWEMFHLAWERNWRSESVWGFPLWIPYFAVPLGFLLFVVQLAADLWLVVAGLDQPLANTSHGMELRDVEERML